MTSDPLGLESLSPAELQPGSVALVGGGPGAWDLITVRGLALLRQAEVVVVDRLGPAGLAKQLGEHVEVVDVGKTPNRPSLKQPAICDLLVDRAKQGKRVVRLKGGDPFMLGRGGEEVLACRAAGIDVQVVPGVSASLAGPLAADIPVTHRGVAVATHIVNAHGDLGPADLAALRDPGTTTVFMMGVTWLRRLQSQALLSGVDPDLPAAVVQSASMPEQQQVFGTLETIADIAEKAEITFPAVIVMGHTAAAGFLDPAYSDPRVASSGKQSYHAQEGTNPDQLQHVSTRKVRGSGRQSMPAEPGQDADDAAAEHQLSDSPALITCAHGTRDRAGRDVLRAIMMRVRATHPQIAVREAYVDVQEPDVAEVAHALSEPVIEHRTRDLDAESSPQAVVVPLLLSAGFHVNHDIEAAITGYRAVAAKPLGPDPRLATIMCERLREAGADPEAVVIMAVSGTRDRAGQQMAHDMGALLQSQWGNPVHVGFIAAAEPSIDQALADARAQYPDRQIAIAPYLLAPGYFAGKLDKAGADLVAAPLGDHPLLSEIITDRYSAAVGD